MIYICIPVLNEAPTVGVLLWRIRQVMTDAPHPAVSLHVPLQVDARAADNWDEAH